MAAWALSSEDRAFALRLASRTGLSSERILAVLEQCPGADIARNAAAPRLALDEPEALLRQDEQIDLVDGPVIGLELEIGPRPVRIVIGQTGSDEIQSVSPCSYCDGVMIFQRGDSMRHLLPTATRLHAAHHFALRCRGGRSSFLQHRIEVFPAKQTIVVHRMAMSSDLSCRFPVPKRIRRHAEVVGRLGDPEIIPQLGHTTVSPSD